MSFNKDKNIDFVLLGLVLILSITSLLMIYSTSAVASMDQFADGMYYLKKQVVYLIIGLVCLFFVSKMDLEVVKNNSFIFLFISIVLLLLLLIPGVGHNAGGSTRWLNLPFFKPQPAEFVKIFMVIFIAGYLSRQEHRLTTFVNGLIIPLFYCGIIIALLMKQPDFGSTAIITFTILGMLAVSGVKLKHLFISGGLVGSLFTIFIATSTYRTNRVLGFLNPLEHESNKSYQLVQSLIAIGSGGLFGSGLGESQQKLYYLPASHTDFIFAVIIEELGLIGGFIIVSLFLLIFYRCYLIIKNFINNTFYFTLSFGLTLLILLQAFFNMGVVTGILPTKGLVLPFLAYGGSSAVANLIAIGLLLNLSRYSKE